MSSKVSKPSRDEIENILRGVKREEDGTHHSFHPNGNIAKEWTRINGKLEGVVRKWHDNGQLALETPYKNGLVDGVVRQWNRKGRLLGEYEMKLGQGIKREWHEDGSQKLESEKVSEGSYRGKVWDDRGKVHETFLWKGKPVSKKKFMEKLGQ